MADVKTIDPKNIAPQAGGKSIKPIAVDIFNCTYGRRVIWDGLMPRGSHVVVEVGETKYNVTLAEWVVKEIRAIHRSNPKSEVRLYDAGKAPKPEEATTPTGNEDVDDGE